MRNRPVEESQGLRKRNAMAYGAALLDDSADDGVGEGLIGGGGNLGEIEGESWKSEIRIYGGWGTGVRV